MSRTIAGAEILPCPPALRAAALELLQRRSPRGMRRRIVAELLEEAGRGELDLSGLWVALRGRRAVGAMMTQALGGRSAAFWPPEVAGAGGWSPVPRDAWASGLVRAALEDYRRRRFLLAQALVEDSAPPEAAADLAAGGLPRVTELLTMSRPTGPPISPAGPASGPFRWAGFRPELRAEFADVLRRSYVGSLDMPELEGIRSLEDILAGHRAGGRFDPDRWRLGRLAGELSASAVLLLAPGAGPEAWEVSYLGLTPEARGRGLGRSALAHALELAAPHVPRLELAVDVRNLPAERLYRRAGFRPHDRRAVHVARLAGPTRAG